MGTTAVSELEVFQFPATGAGVRTVLVDGEPWFVAADVCAVLGYGGGSRNAVSRLPERMKGVADVNTPGGQQKVTTLSEAGVYRLVMRSTMPNAEAFQDWLAEDVVPQIRMTGRYEPVPQLPQTYAQALRELAATVERAEQAERDAKALAPAAAAWDHLASGDGDWSVADAAKILARDPAIKIGRDRLFRTLDSWGWVFRGGDGAWHAKQTQIDLGRLSEMPQSHYHPRTGELVLDPPQVRIKPKGLVEIHRKLGGSQPLAVQQQLEIEAA